MNKPKLGYLFPGFQDTDRDVRGHRGQVGLNDFSRGFEPDSLLCCFSIAEVEKSLKLRLSVRVRRSPSSGKR